MLDWSLEQLARTRAARVQQHTENTSGTSCGGCFLFLYRFPKRTLVCPKQDVSRSCHAGTNYLLGVGGVAEFGLGNLTRVPIIRTSILAISVMLLKVWSVRVYGVRLASTRKGLPRICTSYGRQLVREVQEVHTVPQTPQTKIKSGHPQP